MAITDWPKAERPREKLLLHGAENLSDAELLAIFLRTGTRGISAVDLARQLLTKFGGLRPLLNADRKQFCQGLGLGDAKYSQLQAVLEMGRRHLQESLQRGEGLTSPQLTRQYLLAQLRDRQQEQFLCLFLDSQHRVICSETLSTGTIDAASVYPREVVKRCLEACEDDFETNPNSQPRYMDLRDAPTPPVEAAGGLPAGVPGTGAPGSPDDPRSPEQAHEPDRGPTAPPTQVRPEEPRTNYSLPAGMATPTGQDLVHHAIAEVVPGTDEGSWRKVMAPSSSSSRPPACRSRCASISPCSTPCGPISSPTMSRASTIWPARHR